MVETWPVSHSFWENPPFRTLLYDLKGHLNPPLSVMRFGRSIRALVMMTFQRDACISFLFSVAWKDNGRKNARTKEMDFNNRFPEKSEYIRPYLWKAELRLDSGSGDNRFWVNDQMKQKPWYPKRDNCFIIRWFYEADRGCVHSEDGTMNSCQCVLIQQESVHWETLRSFASLPHKDRKVFANFIQSFLNELMSNESGIAWKTIKM
jgi:hypothetical protein